MILADMWWGEDDNFDIADCTTIGVWCGHCIKYWKGWVVHRINMKTGKKLLRTEWEEELSTQPGVLDK